MAATWADCQIRYLSSVARLGVSSRRRPFGARGLLDPDGTRGHATPATSGRGDPRVVIRPALDAAAARARRTRERRRRAPAPRSRRHGRPRDASRLAARIVRVGRDGRSDGSEAARAAKRLVA